MEERRLRQIYGDVLSPDEFNRPTVEEEDDDEEETNVSLAAMEAELKPKVLETFDRIARNYKSLRKLQDQEVGDKTKLSPSQERRYASCAPRSSRTSSRCRSTTPASRRWSSSSTTSTSG
jgi:hypothetical protein